MRTRTGLRLLAIGALALLLASCFKVNMDLNVGADNTVSGSAIIAVDKGLLELSGQSVDQLFQQMDLSNLPKNASVAPYDDGDFVGQEITFEAVPLSEFSGTNDPLTGTTDDLSIVRQGDEFHVSGKLDMSGQEFTGTSQIPPQLLDSFEFVIKITFPGEVKSATGEVDGHTVTWEPKLGEENRIEAVASAIPSSSSSMLLILLIVVGVLVVAAVAFFLMRSRRPTPGAVPGEGGFTGDTVPVDATVREPATEPGAPTTSAPPPEPAPSTPEAPGSAALPEEEEPPPAVPPVSG